MKFIAFVWETCGQQIEIMETTLTPMELEDIRAITADYDSPGSRVSRRGPLRNELRRPSIIPHEIRSLR